MSLVSSAMGFDKVKMGVYLPVATVHGHNHRHGHSQQRRLGPWRRATVLPSIIVLFAVVYGIHIACSKRSPASVQHSDLKLVTAPGTIAPVFDWLTLTPSDDINWTPCFDEYQCARLTLPLDYLSPAGYGPNVTIALQMLPATDPANFRGTILINPGGPGGAGTELVKRKGKDIMRISGGSYNVLGFDPRGTGASTPSAQCFDSESQFKIWGLQAGHRTLNLSDGSVPIAHARETAIGQKCEETLGGNGKEDANGTALEWGPARFMSTPSVATDMLEITERLGEERLKYWGFSYGSVLGQYYTAMYPDKVERVVIDGILDAYNYRTASWNSNVVDADAVWASLHTFCHKAGSSKCPLYEDTVEAIQARVEAILEDLKNRPLAVPFASAGPYVLTFKAVHYNAFRSALNPTTQYAPLAHALVAVKQNNQTALEGMEETFGAGVKCQCENSPPWLQDTEAFYAVACGDGEPITYTDEAYRSYFEELVATSSFAAPYWGEMYLRCSEWRVRPKWRYTGPLAAENTSHPLLIVSPRYDPVCPLSHANRVHSRYSSGLLIQNSYGHCSVAAPSLCTAKHVRAYFENGTLPVEEAVCEVDELPFIGSVHGGVDAMSVEDREVLDALRSLGEAISMMSAF
ncbi:alpha/beta-hydrolase [Fomitopsis serialis]|uniref:alpha/beta-hydrolase n=1 Tax=Fomitopsis serialis TaxID=139415 RepID=UPI002008AA22|nr:alpha/beta-hydrolase [Neoantrodia serialis]KAH9925565.1 alpha/beta-hydrolase [Neoantrodia serialis]